MAIRLQIYCLYDESKIDKFGVHISTSLQWVFMNLCMYTKFGVINLSFLVIYILFSNLLIIHQVKTEKIITMKEVLLSGHNYP